MASTDAHPGETGTGPLGARIRTVVGVASRRVAGLPPRALVASLVCVQWLLVVATWLEVGHAGSLAIVIPQVVVLVPVALALVYATARRLGGRVFAVWATAVWIVLPYAGRMYALPSLRHDYTHVFLPHLLGLADDPRFPAMVAFLAAMAFTLRAIETGLTIDVAIAVAAAGVGAALVPREALVVLAPLAALALSRERRRNTIGAAAALAIVLAGVGAAVAAGLLSQPFAHVRFREPVDALASLKENFWSGRVIEWLAIAGVLGVFRARSSAGAMVGVALLAAFLSWRIQLTPIETNLSLLRTLLPVWPAVTLAVASLPLLVPRRRPGTRSA
jgi:hypothetical protein